MTLAGRVDRASRFETFCGELSEKRASKAYHGDPLEPSRIERTQSAGSLSPTQE